MRKSSIINWKNNTLQVRKSKLDTEFKILEIKRHENGRVNPTNRRVNLNNVSALKSENKKVHITLIHRKTPYPEEVSIELVCSACGSKRAIQSHQLISGTENDKQVVSSIKHTCNQIF